MGATLEQVLVGLTRRIRRNALLVRALAALTLLLYVALTVLILIFLQLPEGAVLVGALVSALIVARWGRSFLCLPQTNEAGRVLDELLESKNRAATYLDLKQKTKGSDSEPLRSEKQALLEKQLSARLSGFDFVAATPFKVPQTLRRLLYPLPLVMLALLFLAFQLWPGNQISDNRIEALKLARLIQENPLLPARLKQELGALASALNAHALSSTEVSGALAQAQAALAESQRQLSEETGTELEKSIDKPTQPTPTPPSTTEPTPTPEVKPQQQEQQQKKKDSQDSEEKAKEGQQGDKGEAQSKESKDEQDGGKEGQGQGEGKEGGSNEQKGQAAGEQEGRGQSDSGSQGESQEKGEGKQDQQQGSPGEGDQKEPQAKQLQGKGDQKGEQGSKQEGLSKVEESLNQLNRKIEQNKEGKQSDSQEGQEQNDSLAPGGAQGKEEKPDAEEKAKAKESSGEKEPEDGSGKTESPKSQSAGEDRPNSEKESQTQESQGEAPSASEVKGVLFREDGKPSEGLKGEKEFEEVKVPGQNEKYDTRFSGDQTLLQKGGEGSDYRVELKDLELAKPETVQGRSRQPIPLEYKDLLE